MQYHIIRHATSPYLLAPFRRHRTHTHILLPRLTFFHTLEAEYYLLVSTSSLEHLFTTVEEFVKSCTRRMLSGRRQHEYRIEFSSIAVVTFDSLKLQLIN